MLEVRIQKQKKKIVSKSLIKHKRSLQHVMLHVGTPCILVNDLLADYFLFKRGKFPFWEFSLILQQWVNLFVFAQRWKKHLAKWKFLYASTQENDRISALTKLFAKKTNNYYVVGNWFPGTLVGLSKINDTVLPYPLETRRERMWAKKPFTHITGPWDVLISLNIEQKTAAWTELSAYDALTILVTSSTNNPRVGAVLLPGNTNFVHCLIFYFKFFNKLFYNDKFKFFLTKEFIAQKLEKKDEIRKTKTN